MLDLDTGRIADSPANVKPFNEGGALTDFERWAGQTGVDFVGDGSPFLVGAVVFPASETQWEQPPGVVALRLLREARAGSLSVITPESNGQPNYYVFRTREGAIGVLRIVGKEPGISEPPAWHVEYRLLAK